MLSARESSDVFAVDCNFMLQGTDSPPSNTGITDKHFPKNGPRFTPADSFPISADPKHYYTAKYQTIARD
jgi:hypothetical protein